MASALSPKWLRTNSYPWVISPVDNSLTLLLGMKVPPSTPHHGATGQHSITPSPSKASAHYEHCANQKHALSILLPMCAARRPKAHSCTYSHFQAVTQPHWATDSQVWPPQRPRGSPCEVPPDNGRPLLRYGRVEEVHQAVLLPVLLLLGGDAGTRPCVDLALLMHRRARAAESD
eukprot:CAMPEP_0177528364 /NCGR_PEP_ID=MMETSP0369-20130122/52192_1 /TAXON_ID=447022 ORGANISM="Scrippsiella hangoei-like, Strain SHHI-4" /NCGR_SAMPLE_ID=MMETSP0369 /ASSEMBLY_ACC=CAM_ASM_000364 /LENGTH=174 /DNA_ID=CAMNT_0019008879 /DNA_START=26 /DNA_END=547 /DNA_ORIENTATION=+